MHHLDTGQIVDFVQGLENRGLTHAGAARDEHERLLGSQVNRLPLFGVEFDALRSLVGLQDVADLRLRQQGRVRCSQPVRHPLGNLALHDHGTQRLNTVVANDKAAVGQALGQRGRDKAAPLERLGLASQDGLQDVHELG